MAIWPPFPPRKTVTGTASWKPPWCRPVFPTSWRTKPASWPCRWPRRCEYVGVLGVELFVAGGRLLVNEMAPRPHNSGHYTMDACSADQFEQQLRALCGLPLARPWLLSPVAMINLLGDLWSEGEPRWEEALKRPGVRLHLYGKAEARPGQEDGTSQLPGTRCRSRARDCARNQGCAARASCMTSMRRSSHAYCTVVVYPDRRTARRRFGESVPRPIPTPPVRLEMFRFQDGRAHSIHSRSR